MDVNDAGLFKRILTYSNRNPWLYAVYVVVVCLPLVLIVTFCCSGESKKKVDLAKKTDEAQEDDALVEEEDLEEKEDLEEEEKEEVEEEESVTPEPTKRATSARRRKARKE
jgi:calnexin